MKIMKAMIRCHISAGGLISKYTSHLISLSYYGFILVELEFMKMISVLLFI